MSAIRSSRPRRDTVLLEIDVPPANALGVAARRQLLGELEAAEQDAAIRALVLTGRGRAFCSGDDLAEREAALTTGEDDSASFPVLVDRIDGLRVPVIAALNGWAVGGGLELAIACDIRVASTEAKLVCGAVNVGLIASAWRLPRIIGVARAKHMLLTGLPVDAATAERYGLVAEVAAPHALRDAALALAARIASRAPLSVEATKRVASRAIDLGPAQAAAAMQAEFAELVRSRDHAEALAAFREKREPEFRRE